MISDDEGMNECNQPWITDEEETLVINCGISTMIGKKTDVFKPRVTDDDGKTGVFEPRLPTMLENWCNQPWVTD